jgi:transposase
LVLAGETNLEVMSFLTNIISKLEKVILKRAKRKPQYHKLLTVPGIGEIMALTITFETGDIRRFPSAADYSSYCRAVKADRLSNGKPKGRGNQKNGNRYLGWAFVETANFCRRCCPAADRFFQRKLAKSKRVVATKSLANKLSKACYFIMRDQVDFDVDMLFP